MTEPNMSETAKGLVERLREKVAQGWCADTTRTKEMDCVLAEAIVQSLLPLFTEQSAAIALAEEVALRDAAEYVREYLDGNYTGLPNEILAISKSGPLLAAHDASIRERQHRATLRAAAAKCHELGSVEDLISDPDMYEAADAILALPMPPLAADDEKEEVAGEL